MKQTILLATIMAATNIAYAQWQPDKQLTTDPTDGFMIGNAAAPNNVWTVAADSNNVHVVWYEHRGANYEVYYNRSTDGGVTWVGETAITSQATIVEAPSIAVSGANVHVAWQDMRNTNYEVYYNHSTDGGVTWQSADTRITTNGTTWSQHPCVAATGADVHIVWQDNVNTNWDIYYTHSSNNGTTWGANTQITTAASQSFNPVIAVSGQDVHVAWQDNVNTNWDIYYAHSANNGTTWPGTFTQITSVTTDEWYPSIAVSGKNVHLVWRDERNGPAGNYDIYYNRSTNSGGTWQSTDAQLTNDVNGSHHPSIAVCDSAVHVVWYDNRITGNWEVFYNRSNDGGATWPTVVTQLTSSPGDSWHPSIAASGKAIHVAWTDKRSGNLDAYCKSDPTGCGCPCGEPTSLDELVTATENVHVYPNPTTDILHIATQPVNVIVNSIEGRKMMQIDNVKDINVSQLPNGLYILYVAGSNGAMIKTEKILVAK